MKEKPKIFLIRPTEPNRGDVISRHGLLKNLRNRGTDWGPVIVLSSQKTPCFEGPIDAVRPGPLKDLIPTMEQIRRYRRGDEVWWACGHDLQDDSSALKLPFILVKFLFFKAMGLRVRILAQGSGPVGTRFGRWCIRNIMRLVDSATFRDRDSLDLLKTIAPASAGKMGLTVDCALFAADGHSTARKKDKPDKPLLVGVNMRRWYHFDHHWLPYEYRVRLGMMKEIPGAEKMDRLIEGMAQFLDRQIGRENLLVRMIPMYPRDVEPWEDDLAILNRVKSAMRNQAMVQMVEEDLPPERLLDTVGDLDLMIGMRLHSTIVSTMMSIPSIHLAYSPKGPSYFRMIHHEKCCVPVNDLLLPGGWDRLSQLFDEIVRDRGAIGRDIHEQVFRLKEENSSPSVWLNRR